MKTNEPQKKESKLKIFSKFCLLLAANIIVFIWVYNSWASPTGIPDLKLSLFKQSRPTNRVVSGILYDEDNPSVLIGSNIVHEGGIVDDYKVITIYPHKVELEKDGNRFIETVQ